MNDLLALLGIAAAFLVLGVLAVTSARTHAIRCRTITIDRSLDHDP